MSSTTVDFEIRSYVAAVAAHLDDLPQSERNDLMEDLELHLREVAAESDEQTLAQRLGSAESYAAELRTSAGLPQRPATGGATSLRARLRGSSLGRVVASARTVPGIGPALEFLPELRPGWWVLRGYLAVAVPAAYVFRGTRPEVPVPGILGSQLIGLVAIVAGIGLSVAIGRGARTRQTRAVAFVLNIAAVVAAFAVLSELRSPNYVPTEVVYDGPMFLQHSDGEPIANICPYDSKLKPLRNVLLFDGRGRPIENLGLGEVTTHGAFTNSYPRKFNVIDEMTGEEVPFKCPTVPADDGDATSDASGDTAKTEPKEPEPKPGADAD